MLAVLGLAWFAWLAPPLHAATISYVYDELGRLVGVVDPTSGTAIYQYDAVGNLLSISRQPSSVSIIDFTPHHGRIGATVTISGTGFSATASQNSVAFNGTAATVSSSTSTQIMVSVPTGATTGPIRVTSPAGSASSGNPFVVTPEAAPTIAGFTPAVGTAGVTLTGITGSDFAPTALNNKVLFNASLAPVTVATSTALSATAPSGGTSGRITVATPAGVAVSAGDFFIPLPPTRPGTSR